MKNNASLKQFTSVQMADGVSSNGLLKNSNVFNGFLFFIDFFVLTFIKLRINPTFI